MDYAQHVGRVIFNDGGTIADREFFCLVFFYRNARIFTPFRNLFGRTLQVFLQFMNEINNREMELKLQ